MKRIPIAIIFILVSAPVHADLSSGLAGHWLFNDGSGYTVADSSGNGNTGYIIGYPKFGTWPGRNGALEFDGGCEFVRIPYSPTLKTGTMSVAVWLEVRDLLKINQGIYGWGRGDYPAAACGDNYYGFINNNTAYTLYGRSQHSYISDDGVNRQPYTTVAPNGSFPVGGWNHFVTVYDAGDDTIKVYKNGSLVGTLAATGGIQNCGSMTGMGIQEDYCHTQAVRGFSGKMADYRAYTRALSPDDIRELFFATKPVSSDTTAPQVPTGLSASASASNITITLQWNAARDDDSGVGLGGYAIARSSSPGGPYVDIASVPAGTTTWTDHRNYQGKVNYSWAATLSPSTTYHYRIKSYDKAFPANFSPYTSPVSATTTAVPATTYTLTVKIVGSFPQQFVSNGDWGVGCSGGTCVYPGMPSGASLLLSPFHYVMGMRQHSVTAGFNGWTGGGCRGKGPCLIRMESDQAVTAYYGAEYPP